MPNAGGEGPAAQVDRPETGEERGVERTATVKTLELCTLIRVPADVLDRLLMEDLATGLALEQTVARRLVALEAR